MTDYLYPDAVVYIIIVGDEIYVGSTVDMVERLRLHKYTLKTDCQYKIYKKMREYNLDFDDVEIAILQKYPCNDIPDLRRREGEYQRELEPTLNNRIEGRTDKEYYIQNKEHIQEKNREYFEKNKDDITKQRAEYREKNRDTINEKQRQKKECEYCKKKINTTSIYKHRKICPNRPTSST